MKIKRNGIAIGRLNINVNRYSFEEWEFGFTLKHSKFYEDTEFSIDLLIFNIMIWWNHEKDDSNG